jgi:hypothetical protein
MAWNRREALKNMVGAASALALSRFAAAQSAPFEATRQSLHSYHIP